MWDHVAHAQQGMAPSGKAVTTGEEAGCPCCTQREYLVLGDGALTPFIEGLQTLGTLLGIGQEQSKLGSCPF